jgi:hypothetical protein
MSEFFSLVTTIGRAKVATALAGNTTLGLKSIAVGDGNGNPIVPDASMTALVREQYRADIGELSIDPNNPNYMIAEIVIPTAVGGWSVHEIGLFDTDGNLIAVANYPESYKPVVAEGSGRDMQIRLIIKVEDGESESLELQIDPAVVLASKSWVTLNFSLAAMIPGGNTGQILRKKSNADGDTEWYDPLSGLNVLVDTVEEEQVLAATQDVVIFATVTTASTAYYIEGVRLHQGEYTIDDGTQITLTQAAIGGEKLLAVQNEPAAGLDFMQKAQNFADVPNKPVAIANLGLVTPAAMLLQMLELEYPIGEIKATNRAGAPNTWAGAWSGFGTWERFAEGRTLVGFDSSDGDFNVIGKQGGAKVHTLTVDEMPGHTHMPEEITITSGVDGGSGWGFRPASKGYTGAVSPTSPTGGGLPHNNLQPYRVIYYWLRTA